LGVSGFVVFFLVLRTKKNTTKPPPPSSYRYTQLQNRKQKKAGRIFSKRYIVFVDNDNFQNLKKTKK